MAVFDDRRMSLSGRATALLAVVVLLVNGCAGLARKSVDYEAAAAERFESVRQDPVRLEEFLARMPLGGDLHHHVGGAATPVMMIDLAADGNLCLPIDPAAVWEALPPPCGDEERPIAEAKNDPAFRREIERRWSMLDYAADDPAIVRTEANAHFFSIFGKIRAATRDLARLLAVVRSDAASQGTLYLETSTGWPGFQAIAQWSDIAWDDDLTAMRQELLADPDFLESRDSIVDGLSAELSRSETLLGCGSAAPDPGCDVEVSFQRIAVRTLEPSSVFVQALMGFEVAAASPLAVGVNLVAPETNEVSIRDYALHMRIFGELSSFYPGVSMTLHAAEMTDDQAVELGAQDHLPLAIADPRDGGAGAQRVGHAVALDASTGRHELLERMRREGIAVEINLRSNALLLGVTGDEHPLLDYLNAGVPVVLSTDDPGLMGTGLREQFVLAAGYEQISYRDLKQIIRNSIEYSFLEDGERDRLAKRLERELAEFESSLDER
jgi:adenosine deaminase